MQPFIPLLTAFIGAASAWLLAIVWSRIYDSYRRRIERHEDYLAWLRGLKIECLHVVECIKEIRDGEGGYIAIQKGKFSCPVKKLNHDFFQQARFSVIRHPRSCKLQEPLTKAFRDVEHTNSMMEIYAKTYERLIEKMESQKAGGVVVDTRAAIAGILGPVISSLNSVEKTLESLRGLVEEQQTYENQNPPELEILRTLKWQT